MPRLLPKLLALVAVFAAFAIGIAWYGATVPPYVGDLTRLGGYSEDDFGWTEPQARFDPPLYHAHRYDAPVDVLIFGDSMSLHRSGEQTDPGSYWPNYLAARTGWRVAALHRHDWTLDDVLQHAVYRQAPPRVLIVQFAERAIVGLERITAGYGNGSGCDGAATPVFDPLPLRPLGRQPLPLPPPRPSARGVDFSLGAHHLKRRVLTQLLPSAWQPVRRFALDRAGLFSSRRDRELLVFADDLRKLDMTPDQLARQRCALREIQDAVQASGKTVLLVLVVPDKLSTYRAHLPALPPDYPEVPALLAAAGGLQLVRVDRVFDAAVKAGVRDLFLPNDTHPGVAGHRLIADAVMHSLRELGIVVDD
ncbi:alginate O-acetyltransferase AlgX-related protein [Sinimarinibacterium thermocellulolyticum]|uniref:AlgX/AlgJ SGNH hydrolase-like domain-containing protein n=1 Tax=Sinimarinibacterium thermocellulolyticum TaxID=3170016 RepID=A0ABV2A9K3_9GAMM